MISGFRTYSVITLMVLLGAQAIKSGEYTNTNCPPPRTERQPGWMRFLKIEENWRNLSAEEKFRKMREWRLKMEQGLSDLQNKKHKGTITDEEARRLEKMEQMLKKLDERLSAVTNALRTLESTNNKSPIK
ncbi:MAG: hypothetical protein N2487_00805 [Verrucomicrobiae bacterium]|nr:hypothetical protein [Verrucomicrobiae bacterium]